MSSSRDRTGISRAPNRLADRVVPSIREERKERRRRYVSYLEEERRRDPMRSGGKTTGANLIGDVGKRSQQRLPSAA